jgi:glyoxylase-like metal-dependent hydrolase (beta-lactamase superfamily II)
MRKIASGVFIEDEYPAVLLGAVVAQEGVIAVDCPLRVEDTRTWISTLSDLGNVRYMVLLDSHVDRVLGARVVNFPTLGHDRTRIAMSAWSDSFKGRANPIGAEADRLKRITGVRRAVPQLTFSVEMRVHIGERTVLFLHRPGPTPGAIWMVLPEAKVVFIGDAVTVKEPPYFGNANIDQWLESLDDLRGARFRAYKFVSGRDGLVKRSDVNDMARFLRRIPNRIKDFAKRGGSPELADGYAKELIASFAKVQSVRADTCMLRLKASVIHLHSKMYPSEN